MVRNITKTDNRAAQWLAAWHSLRPHGVYDGKVHRAIMDFCISADADVASFVLAPLFADDGYEEEGLMI